jgi:hypothetical protein
MLTFENRLGSPYSPMYDLPGRHKRAPEEAKAPQPGRAAAGRARASDGVCRGSVLPAGHLSPGVIVGEGGGSRSAALRFEGRAFRRYMRLSKYLDGIVSPVPTHRPTMAHPIDGSRLPNTRARIGEGS